MRKIFISFQVKISSLSYCQKLDWNQLLSKWTPSKPFSPSQAYKGTVWRTTPENEHSVRNRANKQLPSLATTHKWLIILRNKKNAHGFWLFSRTVFCKTHYLFASSWGLLLYKVRHSKKKKKPFKHGFLQHPRKSAHTVRKSSSQPSAVSKPQPRGLAWA